MKLMFSEKKKIENAIFQNVFFEVAILEIYFLRVANLS